MFINPVSSLNNYSINRPTFKGRNWWEFYGSQNLIHETAFFREPDTDDFVTNYVRKNLSYKQEINIVSAGCATGEEAYTYAMLLDDMRDKVKIKGFDLSEKAIEQINDGIYYIYKPTCEYYLKHRNAPAYCNDSYLAFNSDSKLSEREIRNRKTFNKYFTEIKCAHAYMTDFETKTFFINPIANKNCSFALGDVTKLDDFIVDDSIDVFSMKNLMYHLVTEHDSKSFCLRSEAPNSDEIKRKVFSSIHRKLTKDGILVFGEKEYLQGINIISNDKILKECGFVPVFTPKSLDMSLNPDIKEKFSTVWKKI